MKVIFYVIVITAFFFTSCASFNPRVKENNGDSEFVEFVLFEW